MTAVETLSIDYNGACHAFPVISLIDRRGKASRRKQWCLVRGIERLLYGVTMRSTGAFAAHLSKCSMEGTVLVAEKACVTAGTLKQEEFDIGENILMPHLYALSRSTPRVCSTQGDAHSSGS